MKKLKRNVNVNNKITIKRGMEYSSGVFDFWRKGGDDGYDTMQWIANQPWSNGVVFSFGVSADGVNAITELLDQPPWLRAQFIIWATGSGYPSTFQGGAFREELVEGWLNLILRSWYIDIVKQHEILDDWWINITMTGKCNLIKVPSIHFAGW